MLGSEEGRSVFFLSFSLVLASGALERREGPSCDEEADPSGMRFGQAGCMARHRAGHYPGRGLYLRRR